MHQVILFYFVHKMKFNRRKLKVKNVTLKYVEILILLFKNKQSVTLYTNLELHKLVSEFPGICSQKVNKKTRQNHVNEVVLVFLLFTLKTFYTFLSCFCWFWTDKYLLGLQLIAKQVFKEKTWSNLFGFICGKKRHPGKVEKITETECRNITGWKV